MPRSIRLSLILIATAVTTIGCTEDRFLCGTAATDKSVPRTCDRAGELCICSQNKCAKYTPECEDETHGAYQYVFDADPACVTRADLRTAIDHRKVTEERDKLCPGEGSPPPSCGIMENGTPLVCPAGDICLCSEKRCAREERTCDSGFMWSYARTCVPQAPASSVDIPDRFTLLCPGQNSAGSLYPEDCGKPTPDGGAILCGQNQLCLCRSNECVTPDPKCATDGGYGVRLVRDGGCAAPVDGLAREFPNPDTGLCYGYSVGDIPRRDGGDSSPDGGVGDGGVQ